MTSEKLTINQSFFVPPIPYLVAMKDGDFERAGLSVVSTRTRSSAEQLLSFQNGSIDVAITAMDNVFVWNDLGVAVEIVGQIEKTTKLSLISTPGHDSLSSLEGTVFAVDALANGFAILARRVIEDANVSVNYLEVGGVKERFDALLDGAATATILGPPLDALALANGMKLILDMNEEFSRLPGQGIVARKNLSSIEQEALDAYLVVLNNAAMKSMSMDAEAGIQLLEENGYPGQSAIDAWGTRAPTVSINLPGVEFIESVRAGFNLLPARYAGLASMYDSSRIAQ